MTQKFSRLAAVKAAAIMSLSTYLTVVLGLVVSALLARSLGPTDYGSYAYVLWLVGLLITFGNHGIPTTATRFISEALGAGQPERAGALNWWLRKAQWISLIITGLGFLALVPFFRPDGWQHDITLLCAIGLICFIPKATYQFQTSVAKGHWAFWVEAWGNMIASLVYTLGVAILSWMHASLTTNLWWFATVSVMHLVMIRLLQQRAGIHANRTPLDEETLGRVKHNLRWTSLQVFILALGARTFDVLLLSRYVGMAEVGYYTLASNLSKGGIELLSSSLSTLMMPTLARARGQGGYEQVRPMLSDACRYFLFVGVMLGGVGMLWAKPAVHLIYGQKYDAIVPVLQVMVLFSGLALLDNPVSSLLQIIDDQRIRTIRAVATLVISAASSWALIPLFGLMGAVLASGVNAIIIIGGFSYYTYRLIGFRPPWGVMFRIVLAALLAGTGAYMCVLIADNAFTHWLGGVVYALALFWLTIQLGVWSTRDVEVIIAIASSKERIFGWAMPWLKAWEARTRG